MTKLEEMTGSLLRQRRNLILTSLILLFVIYTDVHISKINIFGIEFTAPKPETLITVLWLIWLYFLIRFYQYLRVEPASGIKAEFTRLFSSSGAQTLIRYVTYDNPDYKLVTSDCAPHLLIRKSLLKWELPIRIYDPSKGEKIEVKRVIVGAPLIVPPAIKSAWHVLMNTPRVTDYIFPFILAFVTIIAGAVKLCST